MSKNKKETNTTNTDNNIDTNKRKTSPYYCNNALRATKEKSIGAIDLLESVIPDY